MSNRDDTTKSGNGCLTLFFLILVAVGILCLMSDAEIVDDLFPTSAVLLGIM